MKTKLFLFLCGIMITGLFSFKLMYDTKKSTAEVDSQEGLNIYIMSKPVMEYNYLGTVKKKVAWTGQASEMLNGLIKKVKDEYPTADGLIFTTVDMDKADAIKFK